MFTYQDYTVGEPENKTLKDGVKRVTFSVRKGPEIPSFKFHFDKGRLCKNDREETQLDILVTGNNEWASLWEELSKRLAHHPQFSKYNSQVKRLKDGYVRFRFRPGGENRTKIYLVSGEEEPFIKLNCQQFISQVEKLSTKLEESISFSGYLVFTFPYVVARNSVLVPKYYIRTLVVKQFHNLINSDLEDTQLLYEIKDMNYVKSTREFQRLTNEIPMPRMPSPVREVPFKPNPIDISAFLQKT